MTKAGAVGEQIVVMGVSGSGKSTIGVLIADALGVPFVDGDSLHPAANIAKMAGGRPLDDDDRRPWLLEIGRRLAAAGQSGEGLVVACSALKRAYRDLILSAAPEARFVHLHGSREVLGSRLEGRTDHFMPPALLDSQLATLEPLADHEPGVVIDVGAPVEQVVASAVSSLRDIRSSSEQ
jgi:gluconokinase